MKNGETKFGGRREANEELEILNSLIGFPFGRRTLFLNRSEARMTLNSKL